MRPATGCRQLDEHQDLIAYDTPFGIILSGSAKGSEDYDEGVKAEVFFAETKADDPLVTEIKNGWQLENLGISLREATPNRDHSKATQELLRSARKADDGRWEVRLPFRTNEESIHHNWGKSYGRLRSIHQKLMPEQRGKYFKTWRELIDAGYLEPAPKETNGGIVHHIPHFPVIKEASLTTKIRPVLDAAALTVEGKCLNDLLKTGPQVGESLLSILLRFRFGRHAVISDVAKAFYAIGIAEEDRNAVRVLLPKDETKPIEPDNVQTWRYKRLVMGATCSSWILISLLNETIQNKMDDPTYTKLSHKELQKLKSSFYADNSIYCTETIEEAQRLAKESQVIFDEVKFHLREFCATHPEILKEIAEIDIHQLELLKVLGIDWKTITDELTLHKNNDYKNLNPTRRELVSTIASVYDPYGWYSPVTIQSRIIERKLINEHTQWDEKVPESLLQEWAELIEDLNQLHNLSMPRNVKPSASDEVRLIAFTDASGEAFGAAVYAWQWKGDAASCHLLISKAKLRPKNDHKATIPRMELLGIHIGAQLLAKVCEALKCDYSPSTTLFSDSQIALYWVHSEKKLKPYESNWVNDINETGVTDFRFVPTAENPADLPTRGIKTQEIDTFWLHGPEFLKKPFNEWPPRWKPLESEAEAFLILGAAADGILQPPPEPPFGMSSKRYSTLHQIIRVTCYVQRFFRLKPPSQQRPNSLAIETEEWDEAMKLWIIYTQGKHYNELKQRLRRNERPCQLTKRLRLFLDNEGIVRTRGRDRYGEEATADLILLPKEDHFVQLMVLHSHLADVHSPAKTVQYRLLAEYWIQGGARMVGKFINKGCIKCQLAKGKAFRKPEMGQVPRSRLVTGNPPFATTGMDFLGPYEVKDDGRVQKKWVMLLTCGNTRAVHLEMISTCSAKAIFLAMERFFARRGVSSGELYLDNATGNVVAMGMLTSLEAILRETDFMAKVNYHFTALNKKIKFIPVRAPWHGGFYERLVGSVKGSLRPALWHTELKTEEFHTALCRIEAAMNSRPLTEPSSAPEEPLALTPSHFLHPEGQLQLPVPGEDELPPAGTRAGDALRATRNKIDQLLIKFWDRWQNEYIMNLRRRHREIQGSSGHGMSNGTPRVNGVYLAAEPAPRGSWKLVKVLEVYPDEDGVVRTCKVRLPSKAESLRPVSNLVPLEANEE